MDRPSCSRGSQTDRHTDILTDQTYRHTNIKHADLTHRDIHIYIQTNRLTKIQTYRHTY